MIPAHIRTYIYSVVTAAIPLLVIAGIIAADQATLWLTLAAAILGLGGTGLAVANRPTLTESERDRYGALADDAAALVRLVRSDAPQDQIDAALDRVGAVIRE